MDSHIVFELHICPQCGKFAVMPANYTCPYCHAQMVKCKEVLDNTFIEEPVQYAERIISQYYKTEVYDKRLWKMRKKNDSNILKSHNKMVWQMCLKKSVKICPKCARIVTNNYLTDTNRCATCDMSYIDLNIEGFDYYCPELKGEQYIYKRIKTEMTQLGISADVSLPNSSKSVVSADAFTLGAVPALLTMPSKISDAKKRLSDFISHYLPVVKAYCDDLNNHRDNNALLNEFSCIINHIHNVLRGQSFLGQGKAVSFWTLIFIEIEQKYFSIL